MRKFFKLMPAVVMLLMGGTAMAQNESSGLLYKAINDDECKVIKYKDSEHKYYGDIVIPAEYKAPDDVITRKVVEVDREAFYDCGNVTSVTFPETMRVIGDNAFQFTGLKSLTIPANIDSIGYRAFDNLGNLQSLTFEDGDKPIRYTIWDRYNIYTDSLRTLYCGRPLPDTKFRPTYAYMLHTITFGPAVTSIPNDFAYGDTCLVNINWGGNETKIGSDAFSRCKHLPTVTFPESMKEISSSAFYDCPDLASVNLGTGVRIIADNAFQYSGLKSLTIPANVDSIGYRAFDNLGNLHTLTFEDGDTPIRYTTWERYNIYTDSLRTLYCGRPMPDSKFRPTYAYMLNTITFGPAVTSIPSSFASSDTCLVKINWGGNETKIGSEAFSRCKHLPTVTFPESMKEISSSAFYDCYDLAGINLGSGVEIIGDNAFQYSGLQSLTIPANVDSIGYRAFDNLGNLHTLTFEDGDTPIRYTTWERYNIYTDSLRTLYCGRPMPDSKFRPTYAYMLHTISFGAAVTSVPNSFAYGDTCLVRINWGGNETKIGAEAFRRCTHLPTVTFPESMKDISSAAFFDCYDLAGINLGSGVEIIGDNAFQYSGLKSLTIPANVDSIGYRAFDNLGNLQTLRFEDGPTPIRYTTWECYNIYTDSLRTLYCGRPMPDSKFRPTYSYELKKVTFGEYVDEVPASFADGTKSITAIECAGTVPPRVKSNAFKIEGWDGGYKIYDNATLYVREECLDTYKTADYWNMFFKIEAYEGLDDIEADAAQLPRAVNLHGQPVGADYKGIIIQGGKKIIRR